jgi:hypothetical protein
MFQGALELAEDLLGVIDADIDGRHLALMGESKFTFGSEGAEQNAVLRSALANLALFLRTVGLDARRFRALNAQLFLRLGALGRAYRDSLIGQFAVGLLCILRRHGIAALAHTIVVGPALDTGRYWKWQQRNRQDSEYAGQ